MWIRPEHRTEHEHEQAVRTRTRTQQPPNNEHEQEPNKMPNMFRIEHRTEHRTEQPFSEHRTVFFANPGFKAGGDLDDFRIISVHLGQILDIW